MADETRSLYVGLIYNWTSREKRFVPWDEVGGNFGALKEGECLYLLGATLTPPEGGASVKHAWFDFVRNEDRRPLDPGTTLLSHICGRIADAIMQSLPKDTFGPGIGYYCGKAVKGDEKTCVNAFSVPGHYFKLTLEEIDEATFKALPPPHE